jgi:hypothetical protein
MIYCTTFAAIAADIDIDISGDGKLRTELTDTEERLFRVVSAHSMYNTSEWNCYWYLRHYDAQFGARMLGAMEGEL